MSRGLRAAQKEEASSASAGLQVTRQPYQPLLSPPGHYSIPLQHCVCVRERAESVCERERERARERECVNVCVNSLKHRVHNC